MVISLFEEMNRFHKHVECMDDVYNELFDMLMSARELYLEEAVKNRMKPERFIDLFYDSRYHIGCDKAPCLNSHRFNLGIVRNIFSGGPLLVEPLLKEGFSEEDFCKLLDLHLTLSSPPGKGDHLSFGCNLTYEQTIRITEIVRANCLFFVSSDKSLHDSIVSLFECRRGFCMTVGNIRKVAVLFDSMLQAGIINHDWQSVIEKGGFLLSSKTEKPVSATSFSSALSKVRKNPTAQQESIRKSVMELKDMQ